MRLVYTGPKVRAGSAVPLPVGWPAQDHDEPNEEAAKAKLQSGNYRTERAKPGPKPKPARGKKHTASGSDSSTSNDAEKPEPEATEQQDPAPAGGGEGA